MKIVRVEWLDAFGDTGRHWQDVESVEAEPMVMVTVGFEIPDAMEGYLVIAQTYCDLTKSVDHLIYIPDGMVLGRRLMK